MPRSVRRRETMKWLVVVLLMAMTLMGCGSSGSEGASDEGGDSDPVVAVESEPSDYERGYDWLMVEVDSPLWDDSTLEELLDGCVEIGRDHTDETVDPAEWSRGCRAAYEDAPTVADEAYAYYMEAYSQTSGGDQGQAVALAVCTRHVNSLYASGGATEATVVKLRKWVNGCQAAANEVSKDTKTAEAETPASEETDTTTTATSDPSNIATPEKCQQFAQIGARISAALSGTANFDEIKTGFDELAAAAPYDIKADFETLAEYMGAVAEALQGVNVAAGETPGPQASAKLAQIDTTAATAASTNIAKWIRENCS
jgi:hypothetical protein